MRRIRLNQCFVGVGRAPSLPGDIWEREDEEAARLVRAGFAEYVESRPPRPRGVERATAPKRERAVKPPDVDSLEGDALEQVYEKVIGRKPGRRLEETQREQIKEALAS